MSFLNDITVWILDSSSLIETKKIINLGKQWNTFKVLENMVKNGQIAMPKQVINEVKRIQHPDIPGAWVIGVRKYLKHPGKVEHEFLTIIQSECPDLTDFTKDFEDADPHVVALAYQLQEQEEIPCIVTEDEVDRIVTKNKIARKNQSIVSACKQLKLKYTYTRDFLTHLNIPTKNKTEKE